MIGEWCRPDAPPADSRASLAVVYSIAALLALLWLRHQPAYGRETIMWILACVWATDIGAYFIGSHRRRRQARAVDQPEQDLVRTGRRHVLLGGRC